MTLPRVRRASSDTITAQPAAAAAGLRTRVRQTVPGRRIAEHLAVLLLGLLVLVVHDVGYLLRQPFWNDESWVAVTTRFPLSQLPATTISTPIGWSVLERLLTVRGEQTSRLLPLAFAGAAVVAACWLGRGLGWRRRHFAVIGAVLAGTAVLLTPAMLVRDDLKQYTADACLALTVLALTSRLERAWSRRGLAVLSAVAGGGMLLSDAAAFAGVAAFVALCVIQLARRSWRRLAEAAAASAAAAILMLGVYKAFDARAAGPALTAYWSGAFLPVGKGVHADIAFVTWRFGTVGAYFGLGPAWLALPMALAGLVTIFRLGRPATALAVALLWPVMLTLSAARRYPFLDLRTSTFLFAVTAVVAAIGVAGTCSLLPRRLGDALPLSLALAAAAAFIIPAQPYVRSHLIPHEDVRYQARYVAAHFVRGDVILVNLNSSWGFAYYWPAGAPARRADAVVLQRYEPYFPGEPNIVVARNRNAAGVNAALAQALALERACGRIWLVRTHVNPTEQKAWLMALRQRKLTATPVGRAGLSVLNAGGNPVPVTSCQ